uniref:Uncharacterized protein n=1 Tax=Pinctada fucata TaxID=50426 RepID=A0A194ANF5_PINFU
MILTSQNKTSNLILPTSAYIYFKNKEDKMEIQVETIFFVDRMHRISSWVTMEMSVIVKASESKLFYE